MRTTIDIDDPVLKEVKARQKKGRQSLGRLVSELLAQALHLRQRPLPKRSTPEWISKPMHARVDLADKDAVYAAMEAQPQGQRANRR